MMQQMSEKSPSLFGKAFSTWDMWEECLVCKDLDGNESAPTFFDPKKRVVGWFLSNDTYRFVELIELSNHIPGVFGRALLTKKEPNKWFLIDEPDPPTDKWRNYKFIISFQVKDVVICSDKEKLGEAYEHPNE